MLQRLAKNRFIFEELAAHANAPGTSRRVVGQTADGEEVILVEVTGQTKEILGVMTTVVRDRVWLEGVLIEETFDWYAQDNDGNVWYFGEDEKEMEAGRVVSTAGSWQAGVDGARAGIIMWAQPKVGSIYYQEYYEGEAEDIGEVLSLNETITVPFGRFEGCLKTEETTPLEPDVLEHKYYCPGLGHALTVEGAGTPIKQLYGSIESPRKRAFFCLPLV